MFSVLVMFLVISSNIGSVTSSVTVPRSSVVLVGETVELKCSVTGNGVVSWKYISWNSSSETLIYFGRYDIVSSMRSMYKIHKNISGQYNLIINSVDLAHAGRYRCTGVQQSLITDVQLIVLDLHPVCSANTSEADVATKEHRCQHLSIRCSITYTGIGFPVFSWTKSNAENINANTTTTGIGRVPCTSTSLITQQLQANDSGITFCCRITFQTPETFQENAIRAYENTWNYTLCGPRNLSIVEYYDRLECTADGNPTPIYKWTDVDTNISIDGPVYRTNRTKEKEQILECTATNMFGNEKKNFRTSKLFHGPRNLSIVEHEDRLECSANGNPTPTYRWTGVDSKRSIEGHVFKLGDKDQTVQCTAANVFASERKNYTIKNVLHGPRNLRIVEYEDRLECSADGNPTPIYRWTRVDTKSSMEGHVFILEGQPFQCTATNVFGSERKNFTITRCSNKKSAGSIHSVEWVLIVATPTVFAMCLLIIGLKLRKLSIALDEVLDKASANKPKFQPHQSSKRINSPPPTDEYAEIERADASDNYCALADQPTAAQRKEVYCELRPVDQRSLTQSTKQRVGKWS